MKFRSFPSHSLPFLLLWILTGISGADLPGQVLLPQFAREEVDTLVNLPFPVTMISAEYDHSIDLVAQSSKLHTTEEYLEVLRMETDTVFAVVDEFLGDSILQRTDGASIRELDIALTQVAQVVSQVSELKNVLNKRTEEIAAATVKLSQNALRWQLTREQANEKGIPEVLQMRIEQVIVQIDSLNAILQEDFNTLLSGTDALTMRSNQLTGIQDSIQARKMQVGNSFFKKDMTGFFEDLSTSKNKVKTGNHLATFRTALQSDLKLIRTRFTAEFWFGLFLTLILFIVAFWFKTNYRRLISAEQFELSEFQHTIIHAPVAVALFVSALLMRFFFEEFILSLQAITLHIFWVPLIIIVLQRNSKQASPWIGLLIALYFLNFLYELFFFEDILQRIALLLLSSAGTVLFSMAAIRKPDVMQVKDRVIFSTMRFSLGLFALLSFVSIILNLAGVFRVAEFFTSAFVEITLLFLATYVATKVIDALVFILLASRPAQLLNVIKEEFSVIHRKTTWFINFFLWLSFFLSTLKVLNYKEQFLVWGGEALKRGWKIGEVDFTLASILIFIFVIWVSVLISRSITNIFEKDVFTRVKVERGIPNTINMLLKITLITGGFFLAAAAAGINLSNLSLIIGAFSVGIGFGLQNIFNNMVSGLILAFERPIKVGDTVQVGELVGEVKKIGFRSSTIKSYDGAEVIVPNGNLISDTMINWTLTDHLRRMDLRIGVAYGTDPEVVLKLLMEIIETHEKVRKNPAPSAFFINFGESSLDFRLLGWVDIEDRLFVESEINVSINRKLREAGIEIPFPQHDLHIRSDATKTGTEPENET